MRAPEQASTFLEEQYAAVAPGQVDALLGRLRGLASLTTPLRWWPSNGAGAFADLRQLHLRSANVTQQLAARLAPVLLRLRVLHLWFCHEGSNQARPLCSNSTFLQQSQSLGPELSSSQPYA